MPRLLALILLLLFVPVSQIGAKEANRKALLAERYLSERGKYRIPGILDKSGGIKTLSVYKGSMSEFQLQIEGPSQLFRGLEGRFVVVTGLFDKKQAANGVYIIRATQITPDIPNEVTPEGIRKSR